MEFQHKSVLLDEVIQGLNIKESGIYVDGTLGGAGHSLEIVKRLENGRLIGIDQDLDALSKAKDVLGKYEDKIILKHSNYENMDLVLKEIGIKKVDGILLDLGVSSYQLDEKSRGFSHNNDAPLDMRMDKTKDITAYNIINNYSLKELEDIILKYGEDRWAKRIAQFIVKEREEKPIETTLELVNTIKKAIPKKVRMEGIHPAKRTFQAIRIEVNRELEVLINSINKMVNLLYPGGRLAIITFHSLEDRIVKLAFKNLYKDCICPPESPICNCDKEREIDIVTKKPIYPSIEEIENNNRSRSAKLRIAEKL